MSELNQLLLDFDYKTNFNEHDFYLREMRLIIQFLKVLNYMKV